LLVNGLGAQSISFREEMCLEFEARGFRVVRYDNRDVGLSGDGPTGYTLGDMAADGIAVLDAIGVDRAHVWGTSLGGMIVQTMAIEHPNRLLSVTSVMSTTGDPDVGRPSEEARRLLLTPGAVDREAAIEAHLAGQRTWGSPGLVEWDEQRRLAGEMFDRACRPDGVARQYRAARRDGSRSERLSNVTVPMLVLHGTADTLIDHSGGVRTAEVVPGATLVTIEGMGHDHPRGLWDRLATEVRMFAVQCGILGGAA
jgi:pimeloyl-ACP methyl ester carboxylesterase